MRCLGIEKTPRKFQHPPIIQYLATERRRMRRQKPSGATPALTCALHASIICFLIIFIFSKLLNQSPLNPHVITKKIIT
jgi:hypothetical protein